MLPSVDELVGLVVESQVHNLLILALQKRLVIEDEPLFSSASHPLEIGDGGSQGFGKNVSKILFATAFSKDNSHALSKTACVMLDIVVALFEHLSFV